MMVKYVTLSTELSTTTTPLGKFLLYKHPSIDCTSTNILKVFLEDSTRSRGRGIRPLSRHLLRSPSLRWVLGLSRKKSNGIKDDGKIE